MKSSNAFETNFGEEDRAVTTVKCTTCGASYFSSDPDEELAKKWIDAHVCGEEPAGADVGETADPTEPPDTGASSASPGVGVSDAAETEDQAGKEA